VSGASGRHERDAGLARSPNPSPARRRPSRRAGFRSAAACRPVRRPGRSSVHAGGVIDHHRLHSCTHSSRHSGTKRSPCRSAKARPHPHPAWRQPPSGTPGPPQQCCAYRSHGGQPHQPMPEIPDTLPGGGLNGCLTPVVHCYTYSQYRRTGGSIHGEDVSLQKPSCSPAAKC